jgi:beta-lactamase class A
MRNTKDLPIKRRIKKRKLEKKIRFFITVFLTIVLTYYISYAIVKKAETVSISASAQTNILAEGRLGRDHENDSNGTYNGVAGNKEEMENYTESEETDGSIHVPTPLSLGLTGLQTEESIVNPRYAMLVNDLKNYLKGVEGKYGIYFLNLTDGSEFGINHTEKFTAASTVKIPINMYLFKRIKEGAVNPKGILTYTRKDYESGTGTIQTNPFGKKYTVRELSRLSIEISDNCATNMLLRLLGINNVKNYMRQLGGTVVVNDENVTCPKDMALYMRRVYNFNNADKVLGKELMGYFLNTTTSDRIPALLPKDLKIAHKIGTQVKTINDVGIVFANEPYIISVLSKDVNESEAPGVIARISKKVYEYVK